MRIDERDFVTVVSDRERDELLEHGDGAIPGRLNPPMPAITLNFVPFPMGVIGRVVRRRLDRGQRALSLWIEVETNRRAWTLRARYRGARAAWIWERARPGALVEIAFPHGSEP